MSSSFCIFFRLPLPVGLWSLVARFVAEMKTFLNQSFSRQDPALLLFMGKLLFRGT